MKVFAALRILLRILKGVSGCFFLLLTLALLYEMMQSKILFPAFLGLAIQSLIYSYFAFHFARWAQQPIENERVALFLVLFFFSYVLITISIVIAPDAADASDAAEYLHSQYTPLLMFVQVVSLLPLFFHYLNTKMIDSQDLDTIRPDFLVLRSFAFDVVEIRHLDFLQRIRYRIACVGIWIPFIGETSFGSDYYRLRLGSTYESKLREALSKGGGIAATVHNPAWGRIPPVRGTIIKVRRRQDWTEVVRVALRNSRFIVALPGISPGLKQELTMVRNECLLPGQFFFLVPENSPPELNQIYISHLNAMGFDFQGGVLRPGDLYTFSEHWAAIEIATGVESASEARAEIEAWRTFKNRPAPQRCGFDGYEVKPTAMGRCPICGLILDPSRTEVVWPGIMGPFLPLGLPSLCQFELSSRREQQC